MPKITDTKSPYDYSSHFESSNGSSISITKEAIEKQKNFAKEFLIATIKNQIPDSNNDFTSTIKLMMDTARMQQDAYSIELQNKQLDVSRGILLSGLKSFIGTEVETSDPIFYYNSDDSKSVEILFDIPKDTISAKIIIESSNGGLFIDDISTLQEEYFWNGQLNNNIKAKSGLYEASIEATYLDGTTEIIKPTVKSKVTGISIDEKGVPKLLSEKHKITEIYGAYQEKYNKTEELNKEILV